MKVNRNEVAINPQEWRIRTSPHLFSEGKFAGKYYTMEKYFLENDIPVFCVKARSFPAGVRDAFNTLSGIHPGIRSRSFFGISHFDEEGKIVYKAAAQELEDGEGSKYGLESFIIQRGTYFTETVRNFMDNIPGIGKAFERLLSAGDEVDRNYPCIEVYQTPGEMVCMVRVKEKSGEHLPGEK